MIINPVALIAGALSFSAALAWNKAIGDTINTLTGSDSSIIQAVTVTIVIILTVMLINYGITIYSTYSNKELKNSVVESGNSPDAKVNLFLKNNK